MFTCFPAHDFYCIQNTTKFFVLPFFFRTFWNEGTKTAQAEKYKIQSLLHGIQTNVHKEFRGKGC